MIEKKVKRIISDGVHRCLKKEAPKLEFFLLAYEKGEKYNRDIFFISNGPTKTNAGLRLVQAVDILEELF